MKYYTKASIVVDSNGHIVAYEWDVVHNYKSLTQLLKESPSVKTVIEKFQQYYTEIVVSAGTILTCGLIALSVSMPVKHTLPATVKPITIEAQRQKMRDSIVSDALIKGKPIESPVIQREAPAVPKFSIENAFKTMKRIKAKVSEGTNLTKMKSQGVYKTPHLSQAEIEYNVCAIYKYIKKNYQNEKYGINALAKTAQICYETGWFSSALFNVASNVGGQKNFTDGHFVLAKDDKRDCMVGEYPYSRFRLYKTPTESIDYGCKQLLQSDRYKKKDAVYMDSKKWIKEIFKGGYATQSNYPEIVTSVMRSVNRILSDNRLI